MAGKFRGQTKWDPILILLQILTVQLLSYASITTLILFFTTLSGQPPSTMYIFNHKMIRLGSGKMVIFAHLANPVVAAYLLKTGGIPDTFLWYFVNIVAICIMCVTSEFLCRQEEMKSIPISAPV